MAKIIRCNDVGFDCDGVIRADTEEEALRQAAEHAKEAHGLEEITDEIVAQVKAAMREA
jgi:predicted small metal-binding protein